MLPNVVSTQEASAADSEEDFSVIVALGVSAAGEDETRAGRALGEQAAALIKNRQKKMDAFLINAFSLFQLPGSIVARPAKYLMK
jgi:hypothetical protein